jgi:hypothetical protein
MSQTTKPTGSKTNKYLLMGGGGCGLLMCFILLVGTLGGGLYLWIGREETPSPPEATEIISSASLTETAVSEPNDPPSAEEEEITPTATPGDESEPTATSTNPPTETAELPSVYIGTIFFSKAINSDNKAMGQPAVSFAEGIQEVWATFRCRDMVSGNWEQIWFRDEDINDDKEAVVARSVAAQPPDKEGQCAISLSEQDQDILPGKWILELKLDDHSLQKGEFMIGDSAAPTPTPTITPTVTVEPTAPSAADNQGSGGGLITFALWDNTPQGTISAQKEQWLTFVSKEWEKEATLIAFVKKVENVEFFVYHGNNLVWPPREPMPANLGILSEDGQNRDGNGETREFTWVGSIDPNTKYYLRLINRGNNAISYCLIQ